MRYSTDEGYIFPYKSIAVGAHVGDSLSDFVRRKGCVALNPSLESIRDGCDKQLFKWKTLHCTYS